MPARKRRAELREGESLMDPVIIGYIVQALGGIVGGNILGGLLRGGGGVVGRTILGAIGGLGLGYASTQAPQVADIAANWQGLMDGDPGVHLGNLITGSIGGGVLGLIGGLLIRPRG